MKSILPAGLAALCLLSAACTPPTAPADPSQVTRQAETGSVYDGGDFSVTIPAGWTVTAKDKNLTDGYGLRLAAASNADSEPLAKLELGAFPKTDTETANPQAFMDYQLLALGMAGAFGSGDKGNEYTLHDGLMRGQQIIPDPKADHPKAFYLFTAISDKYGYCLVVTAQGNALSEEQALAIANSFQWEGAIAGTVPTESSGADGQDAEPGA